jgi:hypothetical protein
VESGLVSLVSNWSVLGLILGASNGETILSVCTLLSESFRTSHKSVPPEHAADDQKSNFIFLFIIIFPLCSVPWLGWKFIKPKAPALFLAIGGRRSTLTSNY